MNKNGECESPPALVSRAVEFRDTIDLLDRDDLDHADWICWKRAMRAEWRAATPAAFLWDENGSEADVGAARRPLGVSYPLAGTSRAPRM
jgi:hypothetical protein